MPELEVCRVDQLVEGRGRPVRAAGRYLAVFLEGGEVHALENQCLHLGSPLDGGPVVDGKVLCPWHGWAYDLATGRRPSAFGDLPGVRVFPTRVVDGMVRVNIAEPMEN